MPERTAREGEGERSDASRLSEMVRPRSVPDAAFRMIGRATGGDRFPVTGRPEFQVGARASARESRRRLPPLLSIRARFAVVSDATRSYSLRDSARGMADDEWLYEWTVRVGRESDESSLLPLPFQTSRPLIRGGKRKRRREPGAGHRAPRVATRLSGIPRRCRDTL